ncbi:12922_t:CDS:2 [Entrophospora sp. SA101]|nr:6991_t:CDS:2 [Entrophospora sp. SA101]CAJ0627469.1 12922_t:CDS:2 [Entrophospora sp. SA101]
MVPLNTSNAAPAARETKKTKETIKPIADEYIDKEVFESESQIDTTGEIYL